ncbi:hypothetical protein HN873_026461, partial [Arachis hypogaea]
MASKPLLAILSTLMLFFLLLYTIAIASSNASFSTTLDDNLKTIRYYKEFNIPHGSRSVARRMVVSMATFIQGLATRRSMFFQKECWFHLLDLHHAITNFIGVLRGVSIHQVLVTTMATTVTTRFQRTTTIIVKIK